RRAGRHNGLHVTGTAQAPHHQRMGGTGRDISAVDRNQPELTMEFADERLRIDDRFLGAD
ncbi:MAG: hypothetical protein P8O03_03950, partial [Ilumatobacter sp.]|nr:hypothetical protein [Ilumatobacter sp.]